MIIDFHTHLFPKHIAAKVGENLSRMAHVIAFIEPHAEALTRSMAAAGIEFCVDLPVMTRPDQVCSVNDRLIEAQEEYKKCGIIPFGGIHPEYTDFKAELKRLKRNGIKGIKLHPPYQGMDLDDIRMKRVLGAASEEGLITVVHAGWDIGLLQKNYVSVPMILNILDDVKPEKLVCAHMGGWQSWAEVEKDLAGAPVWFDTGFALGPLTFRPGEESQLPYRTNLNAEDFVRIARKHGVERILFATDSPWAPQKEYVEWIRSCGLTKAEQTKIFGANADELLECGSGNISPGVICSHGNT